MAKVGLLYSVGDGFSINRSEFLIGPMILEGIDFYRFTQNDINDDLSVNAQKYLDNKWTSVPNINLDVLIDCSLLTVKRVTNEEKLLQAIPCIGSLKLNNYEVLKSLESENEFKELLLPIMDLKAYKDIHVAEESWGKIAIKSKDSSNTPSIFIVSKSQNKWLVEENYNSYELSESKMQSLINGLKNRYYLQQYKDSRSKENRAISFSLVAQQRRDGAWRPPAVRGAISTGGDIASLNAAAEFIGTPLIYDEVPYFEYPSKSKSGTYLNLKLQKVAISVCRHLEESFNCPLGAVGIKLGVDEDLNPILFTVDLRTKSQSGPGRHLEFYKYLAEFSHNLAENRASNPSEARERTPNQSIHNIPSTGVSLRETPLEDKLEPIFEAGYQWIDSSIGHGGREFMQKVSASSESEKNVGFYSLRVGYARNNRTKDPELSISALEDYLGKGLLRYKESEYMRSVRKPLLERQWQQSSVMLKGFTPDVMFLEDVDLGLRGIDQDEYQSTLSETATYLEGLSERSEIKSWGVTFFNAKSSVSIHAIEHLKGLAKKHKHFKFIAINLRKMDLKLIKDLEGLGVHIVIFSDEIKFEDLEHVSFANISVLNYMRNLR